jgi:ribosome maturation factor RimP
MKSLESALTPYLNREVAAWLNHHDLKVLTGRLLEVRTEHIVLKSGDHTYLIPYNAIAAVRPSQ